MSPHLPGLLSWWLFESLLSWNFIVCSFILSSTPTNTGPHTAPCRPYFTRRWGEIHTHCTYPYKLLFLANALKRAEIGPGIELWLLRWPCTCYLTCASTYSFVRCGPKPLSPKNIAPLHCVLEWSAGTWRVWQGSWAGTFQKQSSGQTQP